MEDVNNNFWWEKIVEYLFVKQHINIDDLIAALDGNHEKRGGCDNWKSLEMVIDRVYS